MTNEAPSPSKRERSEKEKRSRTETITKYRKKEAKLQRKELKPLQYLSRAFSGTLPNAESVAAEDKQKLEKKIKKAKESAREVVLRDYKPKEWETPYKHKLGQFLEDGLIHDTLPRVLISEDVSGRFGASVMRAFLNRLNTLLDPTRKNIPIISYGVGRWQDIPARKFHGERVRNLLEKYKGEPVLLCTDETISGDSTRPLLEAIGFENNHINIMDTSGGDSNSVFKELNPPYLLYVDAYASGKWDLGREFEMRPIERYSDGNVVAAELEEDRPERLRAIEEVADTMYQAFLERPRVRAYLEAKSLI